MRFAILKRSKKKTEIPEKRSITSLKFHHHFEHGKKPNPLQVALLERNGPKRDKTLEETKIETKLTWFKKLTGWKLNRWYGVLISLVGVLPSSKSLDHGTVPPISHFIREACVSHCWNYVPVGWDTGRRWWWFEKMWWLLHAHLCSILSGTLHLGSVQSWSVSM